MSSRFLDTYGYYFALLAVYLQKIIFLPGTDFYAQCGIISWAWRAYANCCTAKESQKLSQSSYMYLLANLFNSSILQHVPECGVEGLIGHAITERYKTQRKTHVWSDETTSVRERYLLNIVLLLLSAFSLRLALYSLRLVLRLALHLLR